MKCVKNNAMQPLHCPETAVKTFSEVLAKIGWRGLPGHILFFVVFAAGSEVIPAKSNQVKASLRAQPR